MEPAGNVTQLSLDCEDMFKEITKKLYGEEAAGGVLVAGVEFPAAEREYCREEDDARPEEHLTAWGLAALMQNGFPPPGILAANFAPRTDPAAEDRWSAADEPLGWAHSRVAAYNPAQRLFKCTECECVGFLSRVAEHWLGTHSQARAFCCPLPGCGFGAAWARGLRVHLARDHRQPLEPPAAEQLLRDNPALQDVTRYLQRLKAKVDARRQAPAPTPSAETPGDKRYACGACPYATDRRDLFTRHENIHRDEKPFHCYLCQKQFNRADHVKKHFLRMHRDHPYDINRIRRQGGKPVSPPAPASGTPAATSASTLYYKPVPEPTPAPEYRPSPAPAVPAPIKTERAPLVKTEAQKVPGGGAQGTQGAAGTTRRKSERRYACCYCSWSGVDNWCLKRHLNTHLKPFACTLCEYKAARAERLATHVHKVHNKKACGKCSFLADDPHQLAAHMRDAHHIESRNIKVPQTTPSRASFPAGSPQQFTERTTGTVETAAAVASISAAGGGGRRRESRAQGAARLFGYLEASDGSGDEFDPHLTEYSTPGTQFPRDKENAAPHAMHHDHCLRY